MHIYLFRHGIAADRQDGMADAARPLTDEGVGKTRQAAEGLATVAEAPEIVLASPLRRAAQTAEIVSEVTGVPVEQAVALGEPNVRAMVDLLEERAEDRVMLVGHEPTLSELAELLCYGQVFGRTVLKKAGCAALRTEGLPRPGSGELLWLAAPRLLRGLV
jgi:phosphohistidine phosphatase